MFPVARNYIPCLDGGKVRAIIVFIPGMLLFLLIQINIIIPHSNMIKALMLF
jgi:hypothetical protein